MTQILELYDDASIEKFIKNNKLVVLFYGNHRCSHCKTMLPKCSEYSKKYPNIKFIHIETSKVEKSYNPNIKNETAKGVPVFVFYINGNQSNKVLGAQVVKIETELNKMNNGPYMSNTEGNKKSIAELTSDKDIKNFIDNKKKSVIFYGNKNCGHCMHMMSEYPDYATNYPSVDFAHVESTINKSPLVMSETMNGVPVFAFFANGKRVGTVIGADHTKLKKYLHELSVQY